MNSILTPKCRWAALCALLVLLANSTLGAIYNVRDFDATGNGVTDDTAAVRAALAAATAAGGGTVYFPAGVYSLAPKKEGAFTFVITTSNITFAGDGADRSILSFLAWGRKDPAGRILKRGGGFTTKVPHGGKINHLVFRDLRITGNAPPTAQAGKWWGDDSLSGWDIKHKALGIWGEVDQVLIERCVWDNWRGEIIYAGGGKELGSFVIRDTKIYNCNASAISMTGGVKVVNCEIFDVYNALENFAIGKHHHTLVKGSVIEPNRTITWGKFGVVFLGTREASLKVTGNQIRNAPEGGVFLSEGAHDVEIIDNVMQDSTGVYAISLGMYPEFPNDRGYTDIKIFNNRFKARDGKSNAAVLFYTGTVDGLSVKGNVVEGNDHNYYGQFLNLGGGAKHFVVANNIVGDRTNPLVLGDDAPRPEWINNKVKGKFAHGSLVQDYGDKTAARITIHPTWPRVQISALKDGVDGRRVHIDAALLSRLPDGFELELRRTGRHSSVFGVEVPASNSWNSLSRGYMLYEGAVLKLRLRNGRFDFVSYTPPEARTTTLLHDQPSYERDLHSISFRGCSKLYLNPKVTHTFNSFSGIADGQEALIYTNALTRIKHVPGRIEIAAAARSKQGVEMVLHARRSGGTLHLSEADGLESWKLTSFNGSDLADPKRESSIWGKTASPAGDNVPNLVKYHLGLDPIVAAGPEDLPTVRSNGAKKAPVLEYWRSRHSSDTEGVVEWSTDLVKWTTKDVRLVIVETTSTHERVQAHAPIQSTNQLVFLRLRVTER